jgi:ribonuclease Z
MLLPLIFALVQSTQGPDTLRVTILGSGGGPNPNATYAGPSALVEYGGESILIDAGRDAALRMSQAMKRRLDAVFLTHLHSDHTVGLPEVWLRSWWGEGRRKALEVYGPRGTKAMAEHIQAAWSYDLEIRGSPPESIDRTYAGLVGFDVDTGVVVYERNGLKVTAVLADHGPVLCYGYRIDAGGHSIVFSGDDRQSEHLIARARGVDVFIHDVAIWADTAATDPAIAKKIAAAKLLLPAPQVAATVFARTRPKLAVFNHWPHQQRILDITRSIYDGRLEGADDLMEIVVGDTIIVRRPQTPPR